MSVCCGKLECMWVHVVVQSSCGSLSFLTCDELLGELYIGECVYVVNCVHDLGGYSDMGDGLIEDCLTVV